MRVLRQGQYAPYDMEREIYELFVAKNKYLDDVPLHNVKKILEAGYKYLINKDKDVLTSIRKEKEINPAVEKKMTANIEQFLKIYKKDYLE